MPVLCPSPVPAPLPGVPVPVPGPYLAATRILRVLHKQWAVARGVDGGVDTRKVAGRSRLIPPPPFLGTDAAPGDTARPRAQHRSP